ncbi:hypothetical protein [Sporisorium scitamineum]|uniref:Uncharacterized protein n=1 Tax=Sporisorium scitamineum TaxID=49012 RepID=A0A0F7SA08_9BASI|nr:hypothetical protein [Sporisorium scitamineum]
MADTLTDSDATDTSPEEHLQHSMALANKVARAAVSATTSNGSGVRLVYSTKPSWPFASSSSSSSSGSGALDIAVLDSSFNPPSRAHLALLLSQPILADQKHCYDGHLLLFSTQNADKGAGKPGDASLSQRVEMMTLMAKDVEHIQTASGQTANVAEVQPRLHWVVGFDTLYRVFQLKYYPSLQDFQQQCSQFFEREGTTFVCARRDPSSYPQLASARSQAQDAKEQARQEEDKLLASENVAPWVRRGSIGMLDIDADQAKLSSTTIRALIKDTGVEKQEKRRRLKELVPPSLVEYLVESRIYRDDHVQG